MENGAATFVLLEISIGPFIVAILLRGAYKNIVYNENYLKFEASGYQYCIKTVNGQP